MWLQYCSAFACSVLFFRQLVGHAATAATALHVLVTAHTGHIWSYLVISGHIWSYFIPGLLRMAWVESQDLDLNALGLVLDVNFDSETC